MADFVAQALDNELHPKIQEVSNMGTRTMAFQVPEELFQQIKEYLKRNHMTQKEFVIGLIKTEIERDLTARQAIDQVRNQTAELAESQQEAYEEQQQEDEEYVEDEDEDESENLNDTDLDNTFENEQGEDTEIVTDDGEQSDDTAVEDTVTDDEDEETEIEIADLDGTEDGADLEADGDDGDLEDAEGFEEYEAAGEEMAMGMGMV